MGIPGKCRTSCPKHKAPRLTSLVQAPSPHTALSACTQPPRQQDTGRGEEAGPPRGCRSAPTDELGVRDRLLQLAGDELLEVRDAAPTQRAFSQLHLRQTQDGFGGQRLVGQLHGDVPLRQGHAGLPTGHSLSPGKRGRQSEARRSRSRFLYRKPCKPRGEARLGSPRGLANKQPRFPAPTAPEAPGKGPASLSARPREKGSRGQGPAPFSGQTRASGRAPATETLASRRS